MVIKYLQHLEEKTSLNPNFAEVEINVANEIAIGGLE